MYLVRLEEMRQFIKEGVQKAFQGRDSKSIHHSRLVPGLIKSRHLFDKAVVFDVVANLPTDSSTGVKVFFATDTDTLYMYNGSAWVSELLT